jgi:hypothetical protein
LTVFKTKLFDKFKPAPTAVFSLRFHDNDEGDPPAFEDTLDYFKEILQDDSLVQDRFFGCAGNISGRSGPSRSR